MACSGFASGFRTRPRAARCYFYSLGIAWYACAAVKGVSRMFMEGGILFLLVCILPQFLYFRVPWKHRNCNSKYLKVFSAAPTSIVYLLLITFCTRRYVYMYLLLKDLHCILL